MNRSLIFFLFFVSQVAYSQDSKYRMQASLGLFSVMNYGTRSFEGVSKNDPNLSVYETEIYDIDYKNFTFSSGIHVKLGWNWVQKKNYSIRQTSSLAFEIYKEQIDFELIDIGNGDSALNGGYYGESSVEVGYKNTAANANLGWVATQELIYLWNFENISVGGGIAYTFRFRSDRGFNQNFGGVYIPNSTAIYFGTYYTKQLGFVFHIEKQMNRSIVYLNLNQQFFTTKKEKGGKYFEEGETLHPVSHNMDFRFPLLIQFGGSIQFAKNKK